VPSTKEIGSTAILNIVCTVLIFLTFTNQLGTLGCWISSGYNGERIGTEYMWLWIAASVDIVLYVFLALVVKGFIVINGSTIRITTGEERVCQSWTSRRSSGKDVTSTVAIGLLFYPVVYTITVGSK